MRRFTLFVLFLTLLVATLALGQTAVFSDSFSGRGATKPDTILSSEMEGVL
jgi:hypothetical protein